MKTKIIAGIVAILLVGIVFISGCTESSVQKETTLQTEDIVLTASEVGEGYVVKESTPRLLSDVTKNGKAKGWKEGYRVIFKKNGDNIFEGTNVYQSISIYPTENITIVMDDGHNNTETLTYEELPTPNIGDKSRAWRITDSSDDSRTYMVEFTRMNVYESIEMYGTTTNYETLKTLAEKASNKIK